MPVQQGSYICRRHSETGAIAAARSTSNRRKEGLDGWMGNVSYNYTHIHHPYTYIFVHHSNLRSCRTVASVSK
jgi:hypothetical protein